jgi:hypothetical protein
MPACIGDCAVHNRPCDLDADHPDDHECPQCPSFLTRQRKAQIAERVAAHRTYVELIETTPDVD